MNERLSAVHLFVGVAAVVMFLATGQYMDRVHAHLVGMDDAPRMLFRSTHMYILFTGLMNLLLGLQRSAYAPKGPARLQMAGSLLVLIVPVLVSIGFFVEPFLSDFARPFTRPAAYSALGGSALLLAAHVWTRHTKGAA